MARPGYEVCTGCHVCVLPCPVWKQTHDMSLTLAGRAKALQNGASAADLLESLEACVLCGACEPVCPVDIDTVGMTLELRQGLVAEGASPLFSKADPKDLAAAIEAGLPSADGLLKAYVAGLRGQKAVVIPQGILHRHVREALPGLLVIGTGESLLKTTRVREQFKPSDLYIIETRGYHADYTRLVGFYDDLRLETGCQLNLDLLRMAIPTGALGLQRKLGRESVRIKEQARWILEGRKVNRVIVESPADAEAFEGMEGLEVVTLAALAGVAA